MAVLGELMLTSIASASGSIVLWHVAMSSMSAPDTLTTIGVSPTSRLSAEILSAAASSPRPGNPRALIKAWRDSSLRRRVPGLPGQWLQGYRAACHISEPKRGEAGKQLAVLVISSSESHRVFERESADSRLDPGRGEAADLARPLSRGATP